MIDAAACDATPTRLAAAQMRVDALPITHTLFPVYMGVVLWAGLFLRIRALRDIIPLRKA